jgi:urease accessory protein
MSAATDVAVSTPTGWLGRLELGFQQRGGRTVLAHRRREGPLAVQRPFYPGDGACHLYLLHPPGGVVGGDRLEIEVDVRDPAHALITTPGAAKVYRSAGAEAVLEQRLRIEAGGVLEWFPHETILFPGARVRQRTRVELAGDARFLGWEIQSLGRPAIGERFASGSADLDLTVLRDGRPLLVERLRLRSGADLDGPSGLRGFPVAATFVAAGAGEADLLACREGTTPPADLLFAMTRLDDLLVARCLARSVEPVHRLFVALWGVLRPRLIGHEASPPRIWAT